MAGLDASVIGNLKQPQGMSLSDMLGIAKGGYELSKMKELYPAVIAGQEAQSKLTQTQAEAGQYALQNKYQEHAQGAISAMQKKINQLKDPKTGQFVDGAQDVLKNDADMVESILKAQGVPLKAGGVMDQFKQMIDKGPDKAENFINYLTQKGGSEETRFAQANPQLTSVGGIPGFATPANQQFTPLNVNQTTPQTQPNAPSQNVGEANQQQTAPQKIVQETFPNRANTPYVSDTEKPRFDEGAKTIQEAKIIGDAATTQLNDIRNARHYISQASGTALGQGTRSLTQLIKENPDLDSLIKSTAQLQMNNASRFGASTDAARETAAAAAGGANISEKALVRILDNAEADLTRDAKYSAGMQNFVTKRGNTGGTLNSPDFKQAWINNAKDRRIYQLININANPELSNAQKTMMRDELLKNENPATVKTLLQQMKAMKQLEKGD